MSYDPIADLLNMKGLINPGKAVPIPNTTQMSPIEFTPNASNNWSSISPPGAKQDVGWWGEGGKLGTIFSGINALGSLWGGYQQGKAMEERNKLFGQDLEHRKAMDLENLANLRVTTQNELERNAFNAAQLGANVPVMGLPQSQLLPNQDFSKLKNLNTVA